MSESGAPPLRLPRDIAEQIVGHALACAPEESCGLLAGRLDGSGVVERAYLLANAEEPGMRPVRYLIDAGEQFRAMRDAESDGLEIVAAFHSHVASEAYPSETDLTLAYYPEWRWVIVSLASEPPVMRAFTIVEGVIDEAPVELL